MLYAQIAAGRADMKATKKEFIARHGITARHFNALRIQVEGMIGGVQALLKAHIEDAEQRLKSLDAKIAKLRAKAARAGDLAARSKLKHEIHQRQRRRAILTRRIDAYRARLARPAPGVGE